MLLVRAIMSLSKCSVLVTFDVLGGSRYVWMGALDKEALEYGWGLVMGRDAGVFGGVWW